LKNKYLSLFLAIIVCFAISSGFGKHLDDINDSEDANSNDDFDDSNESKDFGFDDKKVVIIFYF